MHSEAPLASDPSKGLPTVVPPSGKFVVQLFLVPGIIVAAIVGFLLVVNWMVGGARTAEDFLQRLDDPNEDVRWRGAQDLAQVLLRDDELASNPRFALEIADRLRKAMQTVHAQEKSPTQQSKSATPTESQAKSLDAEYSQILYLSGCLGNIMLPVGTPLLSELATNTEGGDPKAISRRRWRALWTLANLGENLKRFDKLPAERRDEILSKLSLETGGSSERSGWANQAIEYLKAGGARSLHTLGVDRTLKQCASDADPFVREIVAFALNFWEGLPAENSEMEEILAKLAYDDGHGEDQLDSFREELKDADERPVRTRSPGLKIRYNATIALARRGSQKVRLPVLKEMLDPEQLGQNFLLKVDNDKEVPDEPTISLTMVSALHAIADLHAKDPKRDLSSLSNALDALARNSNTNLQSLAVQTIKKLQN